MASTNAYYHASTLPINMPRKPGYHHQPPQHPHHAAAYNRLAGSPPEAAESVTTSGVPSYDPSATSTSSYAGSASEYESAASATGVDLMDYMSDRLQGSLDPLPLDRSLARQAQTSGQLNAKTRQLRELQALAQSRLAATRVNFADGMKAAKEVQRDLDWTQKRVTAINQRAQANYPAEYSIASQRYPAPVDY